MAWRGAAGLLDAKLMTNRAFADVYTIIKYGASMQLTRCKSNQIFVTLFQVATQSMPIGNRFLATRHASGGGCNLAVAYGLQLHEGQYICDRMVTTIDITLISISKLPIKLQHEIALLQTIIKPYGLW